jgi:hypothetical protein
MTSASQLRRILARRFVRRGGETASTTLFENLAPPVQQGLVNAANVDDNELPIVASVLSGSHWLLITTAHIYYHDAGLTTPIDVSDIRHVGSNLIADASEGAKSASDLRHLRLSTTRKQDIDLVVEQGPPYWGIFNVIKYFADQHGREER